MQARGNLPTVVREACPGAVGEPVGPIEQRLILDEPERLIRLPAVVTLNRQCARAGSHRDGRELEDAFPLTPAHGIADGLEQQIVDLVARVTRLAIAVSGHVHGTPGQTLGQFVCGAWPHRAQKILELQAIGDPIDDPATVGESCQCLGRPPEFVECLLLTGCEVARRHIAGGIEESRQRIGEASAHDCSDTSSGSMICQAWRLMTFWPAWVAIGTQ